MNEGNSFLQSQVLLIVKDRFTRNRHRATSYKTISPRSVLQNHFAEVGFVCPDKITFDMRCWSALFHTPAAGEPENSFTPKHMTVKKFFSFRAVLGKSCPAERDLWPLPENRPRTSSQIKVNCLTG